MDNLHTGMEFSERMAHFLSACQNRGVKQTRQRSEIYRELISNPYHPDAEGVFQNVRRRLPHISRDTVYRTLALFREIDLVRALIEHRVGVRYDANLNLHHHFVCQQCGKILDFDLPEYDPAQVLTQVQRLGEVRFAQIEATGICYDCLTGTTGLPHKKAKEKC